MKTIILILIFFTSCKNNDVKKIIKESVKIISSEDNSKNKPKLFLEYWDNMSVEQYLKISETLKIKNVIRTIKWYKTNEKYCFELIADDDTTAIIIPTFIDNKLTSIKLDFIGQKSFNSLYKLYEKKYNLKPVPNICTLIKIYQENNPDFNYNRTPRQIKMDEMNGEVEDSTGFVEGKVIIDKSEYCEFYTYKLFPQNYRIDRNDSFIYIIQEKISRLFDKETNEYFGGESLIDYRYSKTFHYRDRRPMMKSLFKDDKSKTRLIFEYYTYNYSIKYISKQMETYLVLKQEKENLEYEQNTKKKTNEKNEKNTEIMKNL